MDVLEQDMFYWSEKVQVYHEPPGWCPVNPRVVSREHVLEQN